jgi:hypothetical protein
LDKHLEGWGGSTFGGMVAERAATQCLKHSSGFYLGIYSPALQLLRPSRHGRRKDLGVEWRKQARVGVAEHEQPVETAS